MFGYFLNDTLLQKELLNYSNRFHMKVVKCFVVHMQKPSIA